MQRILVTGGAGYVGSMCCAQLLDEGFVVEVVDDLSAGHADALPAAVKLHSFDFGDTKALSALLERTRFDAVFHFAAKASIAESVIQPGVFFKTNVASSIAMLESLRKHDVRRLVFSSSAAVYGSHTTAAIPEDHAKNPINSYGESKLMLEQILKWYASAYGWSAVAFRYFNASGGSRTWGERHDPETHIIPLLLQVASGRRQHFELYGSDYPTPDGTCVRDYVHVMDIAQAHLLALRKMESPGFHAYNIGSGRGYSVKEVCEAVEKITHTKVRIHRAPRRAGDPAVLCASPKRLMDEFGWKAAHSDLETIVQGAWEWEQAQCRQGAHSLVAAREAAARAAETSECESR